MRRCIDVISKNAFATATGCVHAAIGPRPSASARGGGRRKRISRTSLERGREALSVLG
jgi:hypothetical protein